MKLIKQRRLVANDHMSSGTALNSKYIRACRKCGKFYALYDPSHAGDKNDASSAITATPSLLVHRVHSMDYWCTERVNNQLYLNPKWN